jgi:hypothetical protein
MDFGANNLHILGQPLPHTRANGAIGLDCISYFTTFFAPIVYCSMLAGQNVQVDKNVQVECDFLGPMFAHFW